MSSNIRIRGGKFNKIKGDFTLIDHSRQEINIDSYNIYDTKVTDSYNDNSKDISQGAHNKIVDDEMDWVPSTTADEQIRDNYTGPPSGFSQPQFMPYLNRDSFNIINNRFENAFNDYSHLQSVIPQSVTPRPTGQPSNTSSQPASDSVDSEVANLLKNIIDQGPVALERVSEQDAEFRELVRVAIPQIIALISRRELNARRAGIDALSKLSEQAEFRVSIRPAIPEMITFLRIWEVPDILKAVANALSKLSAHAEFRESIRYAISKMVNLLRSHWRESDVFEAVVNALAKLSEQAEFRESIRPAIPEMITFLDPWEKLVNTKAVVNALSKVSEYAELRESIKPAIPKMVALLSSLNSDVSEAAANALMKLIEQAEFRESIGRTIPEMITFLKPSGSPDIHKAITNALSKLSEHSEFRGSIRRAIPIMVTLLGSREPGVFQAVANALTKFSEHAEFRESIRPAIPDMITFLEPSKAPGIHKEVANALSKLSEHSEFHESIGSAIPKMIAHLTSFKLPSDVFEALANALTKFSEQAEFRESFRPAIPEMITFLKPWGSPDIHKVVANTLSKLSEDAEFRELIAPAIPKMVALLRSSESGVFETVANALTKLSEQAEFRESVVPAIPVMITFLEPWGASDIQIAVANALLKLSEHAEFRELIRSAIPKMVILLRSWELGIFEAVASTLMKLSEQAEFQDLISPAILEMITLKSWEEADIHKAVAEELLKLPEHAKFQESIQSAFPQISDLLAYKEIHQAGAHILPQISGKVNLQESIVSAIPQQQTTVLSNILENVHLTGEATLAQLPEQGTNSNPSIDNDNLKLGHSYATTCWIAAEHALQHARTNISSVSKVFDRWKIQNSEYVILAGFDESLITSGVGYLEQIHVFVIAEVDATSPLLSELGRLFSPFSSTLFTETSSYRLPVFKDDGSGIWEFDELVHFTASKFVNGGSSAKTPLTIISLSQTPSSNLPDMTGSSQSSSESDSQDREKKQKKGKERDMGDKDHDESDKDNEDPFDNPEDPPPGDEDARPREISLKITSEIIQDIQNTSEIQDKQNIFQTITMDGGLTIETTPLVRDPPRYSERFVQFTGLSFRTEPPTDNTYKQFHLRVDVDSQQGNARVTDFKPTSSSDSDGEEKQLSFTKSSSAFGLEAVLTPQKLEAEIKATAMKKKEVIVGSEKMRITSNPAITEYDGFDGNNGNVQWDFKINRHGDLQPEKRARVFRMPNVALPSARFRFHGDSKALGRPKPPPKYMDIAITSYWTILPSELKRNRAWIQKLLRSFKFTPTLTGTSTNTQTTSYLNLFQIVALTVNVSKLPEQPYYKANVEVKSGVSEAPKVEKSAEPSVHVTPAVVNDLQKLCNFNLPKFAKFKLSDINDIDLPDLGNCNRKSQ